MWGKPAAPQTAAHHSRTIPTHVGKTGFSQHGTLNTTDHPHACGENAAMPLRTDAACGPSPRMWGKPTRNATGGENARTIPTHVGKTQCRQRRRQRVWDHPHACGENPMPSTAAATVVGPSPRMWGKPVMLRGAQNNARTIPTHVGKTCWPVAPPDRLPDHPHACGENPGSV